MRKVASLIVNVTRGSCSLIKAFFYSQISHSFIRTSSLLMGRELLFRGTSMPSWAIKCDDCAAFTGRGNINLTHSSVVAAPFHSS